LLKSIKMLQPKQVEQVVSIISEMDPEALDKNSEPGLTIEVVLGELVIDFNRMKEATYGMLDKYVQDCNKSSTSTCFATLAKLSFWKHQFVVDLELDTLEAALHVAHELQFSAEHDMFVRHLAALVQEEMAKLEIGKIKPEDESAEAAETAEAAEAAATHAGAPSAAAEAPLQIEAVDGATSVVAKTVKSILAANPAVRGAVAEVLSQMGPVPALHVAGAGFAPTNGLYRYELYCGPIDGYVKIDANTGEDFELPNDGGKIELFSVEATRDGENWEEGNFSPWGFCYNIFNGRNGAGGEQISHRLYECFARPDHGIEVFGHCIAPKCGFVPYNQPMLFGGSAGPQVPKSGYPAIHHFAPTMQEYADPTPHKGVVASEERIQEIAHMQELHKDEDAMTRENARLDEHRRKMMGMLSGALAGRGGGAAPDTCIIT